MKRKLLKNIGYLTLLQIASYVLPLITVPYLFRVIGPEKVGIIAFAQSICHFFTVLVDYGFNIYGTRQVAINQTNQCYLNQIFSSIMFIKFLLTLISAVIIIILPLFLIGLCDSEILFLSFGSVIGQAFLPIWFYIGMQDMKYITISNVLIKVFFCSLVLIFVNHVEDYWLVPTLNSVGMIIGGIMSSLFAIRKYRLKLYLESPAIHLKALKESFCYFTTSFCSNILSMSAVFFLGLYNDKAIVGIYSGIEKFVKAFTGLFRPITDSLFPFISNKFRSNFADGMAIFKKFTLLLLFIALICSFFLIFNSSLLLDIFVGTVSTEYTITVSILAFWLFFGVANNLTGLQFLTSNGFIRIYNNCFMASAIISCFLLYLGSLYFGMRGVAMAILLSEVFLSALLLVASHKAYTYCKSLANRAARCI